MEPWYSGAVIDAVREAKARQALFIVYVDDDSEKSKEMNQLWLDVWNKLNNISKIIALRLNKDTEACSQFDAVYKIQTYPTVYFINGQNGQVLRKIDQSIESSDTLQEFIEESLKSIEPKSETATLPTATVQLSKTAQEKVINSAIKDKTVLTLY